MQRGCLALLVASLLEDLDGLVCQLERLLVVLDEHLGLHHRVQDDALHLHVARLLADAPRFLPDLHQLFAGAKLEVRLHDEEHALGLSPLVARLAVHLHHLLGGVQGLLAVEGLDVRVVLQLQSLLRALPVIQVEVQIPRHHAHLLCPLELAHVVVDVSKGAQHVRLAALVVRLPEELRDLPGRVHGVLLEAQGLDLVVLLDLLLCLRDVRYHPRVPGLANKRRL
mmetsp:Transcript_65079/g.173507  ORF Transcript_65079/g.173507 Transcript_65079/m.173507 type:complete len:225 (+) Transcript_65079:446-1120(+)